MRNKILPQWRLHVACFEGSSINTDVQDAREARESIAGTKWLPCLHQGHFTGCCPSPVHRHLNGATADATHPSTSFYSRKLGPCCSIWHFVNTEVNKPNTGKLTSVLLLNEENISDRFQRQTRSKKINPLCFINFNVYVLSSGHGLAKWGQRQREPLVAWVNKWVLQT